MQDSTRVILDTYQIRKTRRQKEAFRTLLREVAEAYGYPVREEVSPWIRSTNVIVGDLESARVVFTAHYDTCARLPFPNFLAPKNLAISLLYQIGIAAVLILIVAALSALLGMLGVQSEWLPGARLWAVLLLLCVMMFAGPANPHTANDNTSGVTVLTEAMAALPEQDRAGVAFVFFDNEESGLFGSAFFKKKHDIQMRRTVLVNFDCVSDGDHMLLVVNKALEKDGIRMEALRRALVAPQGKTTEIASANRAFYPSDQMHFPMGAAAVALRHKPIIGYYVSRIHTARDTQYDEANIEMLRDFVCRLARGGDGTPA